MSQIFEPLKLPFSTADAERPSLTFDRGRLNVRFVDWKEQQVQLEFLDVIAFSWDEGDAAWSPQHRDDLCYNVMNSDWLKRHVDVGVVDSSEKYSHYKLCFNAAGVLQVLATELVAYPALTGDLDESK